MFFANSNASNGWRWVGDGLHVIAVIVLLVKFFVTRSAHGVSGKTQLLLALTYTARYLDLWGYGIVISYYNSILKVFYISISIILTSFTCYFFKSTYNKEFDTFRMIHLIIPVTVLALFVNHDLSILEVTWTWSIYMESVALIPQLYMIWKTGKANAYIIMYLLCMGLYRGLYIANWVYRYNESGYYDLISITAGIIETFVGLVGFLCVVSLHLSNISYSTKGKSESIYVIPLIQDEFKVKLGSSGIKGSKNSLPV